MNHAGIGNTKTYSRLWDNRRGKRSPLLGKGGDAAPSSKWSRSFGGAAGVVRSTSDNRWLEPTTPSAPAKEASRHFLNGRSHPSLSKEGTSAFSSVVFNAPVSSKRCGPWQACSEGNPFVRAIRKCKLGEIGNMDLGKGLGHLTYSTLVHPGDNW